MKNILLILFCCFYIKCFGQDEITVIRKKSGVFIETTNKSDYSSFESFEAYRLGPEADRILKSGIVKALNWVELNKKHNKSFEKEICRFKAMEKSEYEFHGYVEQFAVEMIVEFKAYIGFFAVEIKSYGSDIAFIRIENEETLKKFHAILNGKSANEEIDAIFK